MEWLQDLKMNDERISRIKLQILKYQDQIQWKTNAVCNNIDELARAAKMDLDAGKNQTLALMPAQGFHDWVKFSFVFTRLLNRDRPEDAPELLDILRTAKKWTKVCLLIIYLNFYLFTGLSVSFISPLSERCAPSNA